MYIYIYTNIQRQNTTFNARILTPPAEISCNQPSGMPAQRESARFKAETTDSTPGVKSNVKVTQRQNLAVKALRVCIYIYMKIRHRMIITWTNHKTPFVIIRFIRNFVQCRSYIYIYIHIYIHIYIYICIYVYICMCICVYI